MNTITIGEMAYTIVFSEDDSARCGDGYYVEVFHAETGEGNEYSPLFGTYAEARSWIDEVTRETTNQR